MRYPYSLAQLQPFNIRVIEGDTHAVYDLPAPKLWCFKQWISEDYYELVEHTVNRVRIAFGVDEITLQPYVIAIPYDDQGREHPLSSIHFSGACSVVAVLSRLGFEPILSVN